MTSNFHWRYYPLEYYTCSMLIVLPKDDKKNERDKEELLSRYENIFPDDKVYIDSTESKEFKAKTAILNLDKIYSSGYESNGCERSGGGKNGYEGSQYSISKRIVSLLDRQHSLITKVHSHPTHMLAYGKNIPSILYDNFDYILFIDSSDASEYLRTRNGKQTNPNVNAGIMINNTECDNVIQTILN